jgi:hypothetical protein
MVSLFPHPNHAAPQTPASTQREASRDNRLMLTLPATAITAPVTSHPDDVPRLRRGVLETEGHAGMVIG